MTNAEATELAKSCLLAVANNDVESAPFVPTLRLGLRKWLDGTNRSSLTAEEIQQLRLALTEKEVFPSLEAFLFYAKANDGGIRQLLLGINKTGQVSEFAFLSVPQEHVADFLDRLPLNDPWFHVAGHSMQFKLNGLMPFQTSGGLGCKGRGERAIFSVAVPRKAWTQLPDVERSQILEKLDPIALDAFWLHFNMLGPQRQLRIAVIESRDKPGHVLGFAGDPPNDWVLADRVLEIPQLR